MSCRTSLLALRAALVAWALGACQTPSPGPVQPPPSPADAQLEDLTTLATELLEGTHLPALSLAVVVDGELAATGAAGLRRVGSPERVTAADRFHIGSCTKSMTATLAAILIEEGLATWDTTIGDAFPDLDYAAVFDANESARHVSLELLLTNRGGFSTGVEPELWAELWAEAGTPTEMRRRLVEACAARPLPHWPVMIFEYSNTGFAIAGAMLEQLAGEPYEELLASRLFEPLGMTSAGFRAPATLGSVDQPYGHILGGEARDPVLVPVDPEPAGDNPRAIAPAGAVHLSAVDLARFAQLHLGTHPGWPTGGLVDELSLAKLHSAPPEGTYAMGWVLAPRPWAGGTALTHSGSNTMFYAVMWLAPERGFAAIALTNVAGDEAAGTCDAAIGALIRAYLGGPD